MYRECGDGDPYRRVLAARSWMLALGGAEPAGASPLDAMLKRRLDAIAAGKRGAARPAADAHHRQGARAAGMYRHAMERQQGAAEGQRNQTLYTNARRMQRAACEEWMFGHLASLAQSQGLSSGEINATVSSGRRAGVNDGPIDE